MKQIKDKNAVALGKKRKIILSMKEKAFNDKDRNYEDYENYIKERDKFINFCVSCRLSYEITGKLVGLTKARIYQIYRYGTTGKTFRSDKEKILKRDKNRCLVCRTKGNVKKPLHIHHINNPKSKKDENLASLCSSCHRQLDYLCKKDKEFKEYYAKKLSTCIALQK